MIVYLDDFASSALANNCFHFPLTCSPNL